MKKKLTKKNSSTYFMNEENNCSNVKLKPTIPCHTPCKGKKTPLNNFISQLYTVLVLTRK